MTTLLETTISRRVRQPVLAKRYGDALYPKTFANRTQALAAVAQLARLGQPAFVTARWPFLVVLEVDA